MSAWLNGLTSKEYLTLDKELRLFQQFIELTPEEIACRNKCISKLKSIIETKIPNSEIKPYGSFVYGLSLPSSDLDLVLLFKDGMKWSNTRKAKFLKRIAQLCRLEKTIKVEETLLNTRIPIIKLTDIEYALSIDISIETETGIVSTSYIQSLMAQYPLCKTLVLFLKFLLLQNSLNEPYHGGLGSYAIVLLVCTYLKENPTEDAGVALTGILQFYGSQFKMRTTAISIEKGFYKFKPTDEYDSCPLIVDPCEENNNVGRPSFKFTTIQYLFKKTLSGINNQMKNPKEKYLPKRSRLGNVVAISESLMTFRLAIKQKFITDCASQMIIVE